MTIPIPLSLTIYCVEINNKMLWRFFLNKNGEELANGTAKGFHTITDLAQEAIVSNYPDLTKGKPSSLTDIAFDTGQLTARINVLKDLKAYLNEVLWEAELGEKLPNEEWLEGYKAALEQVKKGS